MASQKNPLLGGEGGRIAWIFRIVRRFINLQLVVSFGQPKPSCANIQKIQ